MKAIIYARVSSTGDRQDTARQVDDLTRYATANGLTVEKVYTEHASGAKKRSERPVLNECLMHCLTAPKETVLLVSELSRLGRNTPDLMQNVTIAREAGLNIYFQKEAFSIFTPDGKPHPFLNLLIAVLGTCSEIERENIRYRLNSGKARYEREGGKVGRKPGYRMPLEKYEEKYPRVFRLLRQEHRPSLKVIADACNIDKRTVMTCAHLLEETEGIPTDPKGFNRRKATDTPTDEKTTE